MDLMNDLVHPSFDEGFDSRSPQFDVNFMKGLELLFNPCFIKLEFDEGLDILVFFELHKLISEYYLLSFQINLEVVITV